MTKDSGESGAGSDGTRRGLSRAGFLRRSALTGGAVLGAPALLAGCGQETGQQDTYGGEAGFPGSPDWEAAVSEMAKGRKLSIGFTPPILSEFFDEIEHAAWRQMDWLQQRFGIKWEWARTAPAGFDAVEGHVSVIEDWVTKGFDAILICTAGDFASMQRVYESAQDRGTSIFQFNMPVELWPTDEIQAVSNIGYDEARQAGFVAGRYIAEKLNGKGKIIQVWGPPGNHWSESRQNGLDLALKQYPGLEVVGKQNGGYVRDQGLEAAQNLLERTPDVNAIYGENEEMALGASQAIDTQGLKRWDGKDGIITIGADGLASGFEEIKADRLTATVDVGPVEQGRQSIQTVFNSLVLGQTVDRVVNVPTTVVDKSNVDMALAYVQWALDGPEY